MMKSMHTVMAFTCASTSAGSGKGFGKRQPTPKSPAASEHRSKRVDKKKVGIRGTISAVEFSMSSHQELPFPLYSREFKKQSTS